MTATTPLTTTAPTVAVPTPDLPRHPDLPHHPTPPPCARTVDRHLVHRQALGEVFLTDTGELSGSTYLAAAQLPRTHAYYGDHRIDDPVHDPLLVLEACRQAGIASAVQHFGIPAEAKAILTHVGLEVSDLDALAVGDAPLALGLRATTSNLRHRDGAVTGYDTEFTLEARGREAGTVRIGLAYRMPEAYLAMRLRGRDGSPLPSSQRVSPTCTTALAEPEQVGRGSVHNVVLAGPRATPEGACAELGTPVHHPSMFDHPQDHVPGMVLLEAARQLALFGVHETHALSTAKLAVTSLSAVFRRFAELDGPITLVGVPASLRTAPATTAAPPQRLACGTAVRVEAMQSGEPVAEVDVQLCARRRASAVAA